MLKCCEPANPFLLKTLASTIYTYLKFRTVSGTLKCLQSQVHLKVTELTTALRSRKGPRFSAPVTTSSRLAPIWPTVRDHSHIVNIGKNILRKMLWMGEPIIWKHGPKENYAKWDFSHLSEFTRTLIFCCTYILRGRKKTQEKVDLWQKERKNYFLEVVFSEAIFA